MIDTFIEDMLKWFSENPISESQLKKGAENIPAFPIMRGKEHPMYGKKHSDESRLKIKIKRSLQKIVHSEETKNKIKLSNKGKEKTLEHRKKLSEAQARQKGKYTAERLKKMSEISSGGKNHKAKQVRAEWKTGETKVYDCIKDFSIENEINYESSKLLVRHGKYSRTKGVRLVWL